MEEYKYKDRVLARLARMVGRLFMRSAWHIRGLLLWLLQRPSLRWVPMPYPAISTVKQWEEQAESMVNNRSLARRHWVRARQAGAFTMQNLRDGIFLRNRLGYALAFMEDPLLTGMLAARTSKGMASRIREEAIREAKLEAAKLKDANAKKLAVRELIGPRGGLPTLRQDLLRLAALLHLEIEEKDTVAMIRDKCRPAVDLLMNDKNFKKGKLAETPAQSSGDAVPKPKALAPAPVEAKAPLVEAAATPGLSLQQVQAMLAAQEGRFQTMLSQVMQHIIHQQAHPVSNGMSAPEMPDEVMEAEDAETRRRRMDMAGAADPPQQFTLEEQQQMNADYYQDMWEQRAAMGGAAFANEFH